MGFLHVFLFLQESYSYLYQSTQDSMKEEYLLFDEDRLDLDLLDIDENDDERDLDLDEPE